MIIRNCTTNTNPPNGKKTLNHWGFEVWKSGFFQPCYRQWTAELVNGRCVRGNRGRRIVKCVGVLSRLRLQTARTRQSTSSAVTEEPKQHGNRVPAETTDERTDSVAAVVFRCSTDLDRTQPRWVWKDLDRMDRSAGWSKKRIPSFIFGITSVIQHRF